MVKQKEFSGMPKRDEIGSAAEKLIEAEERLSAAQKDRDFCENELFKTMRKNGKQSLSLGGRKFSLRIIPAREVVAISKKK